MKQLVQPYGFRLNWRERLQQPLVRTKGSIYEFCTEDTFRKASEISETILHDYKCAANPIVGSAGVHGSRKSVCGWSSQVYPRIVTRHKSKN